MEKEGKIKSLVSIVPPAKCSIIYLCKHDVNERVRGKHKQISLRFVMTFARDEEVSKLEKRFSFNFSKQFTECCADSIVCMVQCM